MYLPTHVTSLINWYPEQQISVLFLVQNLIIVFICLKTFDQVYLILLLHKFQNWAYDKCVQNGNTSIRGKQCQKMKSPLQNEWTVFRVQLFHFVKKYINCFCIVRMLHFVGLKFERLYGASFQKTDRNFFYDRVRCVLNKRGKYVVSNNIVRYLDHSLYCF